MFPNMADIPIIGQKKDQRPLSRRELIMFSQLHEWAVREGVTVVCKACDSAITGANSGHEPNPSIACKCREWIFR